MAAVDERPTSVCEALRAKETLVGTAILMALLIGWMAVVSPRLEGRLDWAATPWSPLVFGLVVAFVLSLRRQRREMAEDGIRLSPARKVARRALRTGRPPDDRRDDAEIRAHLSHVRSRQGEMLRWSWVIVLVTAATQYLSFLAGGSLVSLGLAAGSVALALLAWWVGRRTLATWDRLEAALDARRDDAPPAGGL